jgi:hypothetical protein
MQYGQFEEALVRMFSIDETNLNAFRARLRHLRDLRIPNIPKRGSGNTFSYRREDLLVTFVALALQTLGSTPTISAIIAAGVARQFHWLQGEKDVFLVVANIPESIEDTPRIMPGVRGSGWINNPFGGSTFTCIVVGAAEAGNFVTSTKTIASSVINLSERFRALPKDA